MSTFPSRDDAPPLPGLAAHMAPIPKQCPKKRRRAETPANGQVVEAVAVDDLDAVNPRPMYEHQAKVYEDIRQTFRDGCSAPALQAATGFGKTILATHVILATLKKGRRVVVVVPFLGLIDQWIAVLIGSGFDPNMIGVIQADHPWHRPNAAIQVACVDSLARRKGRPSADLVIVDECHRRSKFVEAWILDARENGGAKFIGLSATPWTAGLGKFYDRLVKGPAVAWLIEHGFLSTFRVFAPSAPDLSDVRTVAGEFHKGELAAACNRPQLVADVVSTWLARAKGLPTLVFAVNRQHAKALAEQFGEAGIAVAYVDANTPREERTLIGEQLASGEVQVVVNIGCLTTGIDWDLRCLVLARPTKSEALYVQIIGRALRTAPGKTEALILDHSDTTLRLGLPTDIDSDSLDMGRGAKGGSRKQRERPPTLPKCCPSCTSIMPLATKTCLECGHTMPTRSNVDTIDGVLVEIGAPHPAGKPQRSIDAIREMGRSAVHAQLMTIQAESKCSDGWRAHKFREVFGDYPSSALRHSIPAAPTNELKLWVRSRDIAFHASRNRAGVRHG